MAIRGRKRVVVQGPYPCSSRSLSPDVDGLSDLPLNRLPVVYTSRGPVDMMSGVELVFRQSRRTVSRRD